MPEFCDGQFDAVLDKGTLDAIMCGHDSYDNACLMIAEVYRVLRPGGVFVEITYGSPDARLPHLGGCKLQWDIQVFTLLRPAEEEEEEGLEVKDKEPEKALLAAGLQAHAGVHINGPFDATDESLMAGIDDLCEQHFVYVCTKRVLANGTGSQPVAGVALQ